MPTLPPIDPERTASGIAVDPKTLERVVPQTKRPDGRRVLPSRCPIQHDLKTLDPPISDVVLHSVRKELKIRPGFTPQEDVNRFRGKRQAMADAMKLPPGHIVGWIPPSTESVAKSKSTSIISNSNTPLTKAALKNAKRKAKRKEAAKTDAAAGAPENWDDEEEEDPSIATGSTNSREDSTETGAKREGKEEEVEAEALVEKLDDLALS